MRYDAEWLLECLMLRIKSSGVYNHLREIKMLPLPHPTTLGRMLSSISCKFGFNKMALEAIEKMLSKCSATERLGVLTFDEIKIAENFQFSSQSFAFDGRVDLGHIAEEIDENEENTDKNEENTDKNLDKELADHAVVFMFRSLLGNWVQPFAVFTSKGAAPGQDLFRLLLAGIIRLEEHGARVTAVTSDGAQNNKAVWMKAHISIVKSRDGKESITNSMPHPTVVEKVIYFFLDPPHAFKCIRNQILNHGDVQV